MLEGLTERERTTLTTALSVAAERYREHALEGACMVAFGPVDGAAPFTSCQSLGAFLVRQFHQQAEEACALLAKVEA